MGQTPTLSLDDWAVLDAIGTEDYCFTFLGIQQATGLSREVVRASCRRLRGVGLARFQSGLMSEDGDLVGSGYGATKAGCTALSNRRESAGHG